MLEWPNWSRHFSMPSDGTPPIPLKGLPPSHKGTVLMYDAMPHNTQPPEQLPPLLSPAPKQHPELLHASPSPQHPPPQLWQHHASLATTVPPSPSSPSSVPPSN